MGKKTAKPITAILIGAGTRGLDAYGKYALENPSRLKFIAVADLNETKRTRFQKEHKIPDEHVFSSWEELLSEKNSKIAQVAFICTPDQIHYKPAIKALELDYDLVLEKPIAPKLEECLEIAQLAKKKGRFVQVCHVLRYTEFFKKIKNFVESGKLGRIIHYDHSENVSYWHFGHSFVRGAYKNRDTSAPIVLAKTCHDLDLIFWIMNEKPTAVFSIGELTHYKIDNAPPNSPERCIDGCPISEECAWYAPRLYLELEPLIRIAQYSPSKILRFITKMILKSQKTKNFLSLFSKDIRQTKNWDQFPVNSITTDFTLESKMKALKEGPFGLCIYKTGNDVPDHQISTFNFPSGATATLTMHGLSEHEGRELRIFGTNGVIRGVFRNNEELITFTDFRFGKIQILHKEGFQTKGHGGGDKGIMDAFTAVFLSEVSKELNNLSDVSIAMESHFMGFAAEESRLTNKIQRLEEYRKI
ncbi:MAG TPA: Gfo/Idh/MocA family oxidoreductase [candidate division Zixibacteria bacterium]|nr:Gfo/Idh/MocA family oxidoreductase [candidate division Zixibacteria bacterium]